MNILHVAPDEKFIDSAIWQFQKVTSSHNMFLILLDEGKSKALRVKNVKTPIFKPRTKKTLTWIKQQESNVDLVCFHGIDSKYIAKVILNLSVKTRVLWFLFGAEVYNNRQITRVEDILLKDTLTYNENPFKSLEYFLKIPFRKIKGFLTNPDHHIVRAIKRADYCGILFEEELENLNKRMGISPKHVVFCYYPIEFILKEDLNVSDNNILLGNSATITNNHLDIFEMLKEFDLENRRLIVPLNYGDNRYKTKILSVGKKIFKNRFNPLVHFMPLDEYNRCIESCSIAIMPHIRQQAVGNVLVMLYMGAKVYLSNRNTVFHYLKRLNVTLFSIEEDLMDNEDRFKGLSAKEKKNNKDIVSFEIGKDRLLPLLEEQLKNITL